MSNSDINPLCQTFILRTNGDDPEMDAAGIMIDALSPFKKSERDRIMAYVYDRCVNHSLAGGRDGQSI